MTGSMKYLLGLGVEYESDSLADVPARALDGGVAVDVAELAEAEAVVVLRRRVREAVDVDVVVRRVEHLEQASRLLKVQSEVVCVLRI